MPEVKGIKKIKPSVPLFKLVFHFGIGEIWDYPKRLDDD